MIEQQTLSNSLTQQVMTASNNKKVHASAWEFTIYKHHHEAVFITSTRTPATFASSLTTRDFLFKLNGAKF